MTPMLVTVFLGTLLVCGAPISLIAAINLWNQGKPIGSKNPQAKRRLDLVQRGLNVADMIVIWVYVPVVIGRMHIPNFDEMLGNFGCKAHKFVAVFGFTAVSNCIVAISICRLQTIMGLSGDNTENVGRFRYIFDMTVYLLIVHTFLRLSLLMIYPWVVSTVCSLPQLFIFRLVNLSVARNGMVWCGSVLQSLETKNSTFYTSTYYIFHETTMFVLPAFFIILINIIAAVKLHKLKRNKFDLLCRNQLKRLDSIITSRPHGPNGSRLSAISQFVQTNENLEVRVKMSKTPLLLVLTYLLCWTPYIVISFIPGQLPFYFVIFYHANVLISVLNPILYRLCRSSSALVTLRRQRPSCWKRLKARKLKNDLIERFV